MSLRLTEFFRALVRIPIWPFRHWRVFAILAVLLVIAYLILDQVLLRRLVAQEEALRAAGIPVSFADFNFPELKDSENAAVAYRYIASQIRYPAEGEEKFNEVTERLRRSRACGDAVPAEKDDVELSSDDWDLIGRYVALNEKTYDLFREAQQLPDCQFLKYNAPQTLAADPGALLPDLTLVRQLARHAVFRAAWEQHEGRTDEAYAWTIAGLHLANSLGADPLLITGLVRLACAVISLESLQQLMCQSELPDPLPEGLMDELTRLADRGQMARFFKGELCYSNVLHESGLMGSTPRPFNVSIRIAINKFHTVLSPAIQEEDYGKRQALLAPYAEVDPAKRHFLPGNVMVVGIMAPAFLRTEETFERVFAQTHEALLAIGLKRYKQQHGAYPDALDALVPDCVPALPQDPFDGQPFRYRRAGDGFVLYSVGPDRKDDGGTYADKRGGDLVWSAMR